MAYSLEKRQAMLLFIPGTPGLRRSTVTYRAALLCATPEAVLLAAALAAKLSCVTA